MLKHHPVDFVLLFTLMTVGCGGSGSTAEPSSDDEVQVLNPSTSDDADDTDDTDDTTTAGGSEDTETTDTAGTSDASTPFTTSDIVLAAETCDNATDDDEDGLTDCDDDDCADDEYCQVCLAVMMDYYADADGDGYGDPLMYESITDCADHDGYVSNADDCDDGSADAYPSAAETANDGIDQDCDGEDLITLTLGDINTSNTDLLWVATTGDDSADCAFATPCLTLQGAIDKLTSTDQSILVMEGIYRGGFSIDATPARIYGGIHEDTSSGESVWESDPVNNPSSLVVTRTDEWIDITAGDARNILQGLTIVAGNQENSDSDKAELNIENTSVLLKSIIIRSANDLTVEESAYVKMAKAVYSEDGDFRLDVERSTFRSGVLVGQEGTTTNISVWLMAVQATHADAEVAVNVSDSRFNTSGVTLNASAIGFTAGFTASASADLTNAMRLDISDNRFTIGSSTFGDGILIGAPVTGVIDGNNFQHTGSVTDFAVYASNGSASTLTSSLRLSNNVFDMDNTNGIGNKSYAVNLVGGTALTMNNNTVVHSDTVVTGYGLYVAADVDLGITLSNNIFSNSDTDDEVNIYLNEVPTTALTLANNLFYCPDMGDMVVKVDDGTSISIYYSEADVTAALSRSFTFRSNVYAVNPVFASDYTPEASEIIDAGYLPASLDTSDLVDILGNSRVVDGDGDGTATVDIGAVEIQ